MKIEVSAHITTKLKLCLRVNLWYGKDNQYRTHIFRSDFPLEKGGEVFFPLNFFHEYADKYIKEDDRV